MSDIIKEYQIYNKHIYEFDFTLHTHIERNNSPYYNTNSIHQKGQYDIKKYYIDTYKRDGIDGIMVIKNRIFNRYDIDKDLYSNKFPNIPKEVIIFKYSNNEISIKLSDRNIKHLQSLSINSKYTYDKNNKYSMIINITPIDLYNLIEYLLPMTDYNDTKKNELKGYIYEYTFGTSKINEIVFKDILIKDYNQAIQYLDKHLDVLPTFIDIVYFYYNDPRYFEVLHEKINNVIVDDNLLSLYSDEDIKKIYYVLALIIVSNQEIYNTRQGKSAILEYLFKADDYLDSRQLRNRIDII